MLLHKLLDRLLAEKSPNFPPNVDPLIPAEHCGRDVKVAVNEYVDDVPEDPEKKFRYHKLAIEGGCAAQPGN